ncbi:beta-ribofuranosylaminobenzene 5'-phosphate synthase family protein [Haloplanus sp. GCM10025708]|uniref:beta-ribofuranosylaminobenzene 5'-phosphate synthase family protein n=1 Tax=Haloferacaceae TaxID=1644056 RepID=UPI003621F589
MARVTASARVHFGFLNLSLANERLYGGLGVALDQPRVAVTAARASGVDCADPTAREYARRAVDLLEVPGARVRIEESFPRHVGLGSGTQFALATLGAIADAYDRTPAVRSRAPALGRGGRSGVGVAAFEDGGFVLDAGHPTARFTTAPPADGDWTVPAVAARHELPDDWRFLLVVPDVDAGRSGTREESSMRAVVEGADPAPSDRIAGILTRRLLPAVAEGDVERFGSAVAEIGRLNGAWYADEQGGVYRPPVGELVASLSSSAAVDGAGQSSWGPAVYGVTDADRTEAAANAGRNALDAAGLDGQVRVVSGRNRGATRSHAERHNA